MADITLEGTQNPVTTTEAVRLAAGLDISEYPDSSFSQSEIVLDLELELNDWLADASLDYQTIISGGFSSSPTTEQRRDFLLLKRHVKNRLAVLILKSVAMAFPKELSDGDDSFKRFASKVEETMAQLEISADEARKDLLRFHGKETKPMSMFSGSGNVYDPVTGETSES